MEKRFARAVAAIGAGDEYEFGLALDDEPELATERSIESHPTLMQCLVLDGKDLPDPVQAAMAQRLVDLGSPIDEPLIACGSTGNTFMALWLTDRGAALNGSPDVLRGWSVLEEAIYWGKDDTIAALLARGASLHNLRIAAGLGRVDEMRRFFDEQGALREVAAGAINWPFGGAPPASEKPRDLLDHALVYAAMSGEVAAVEFLIERGATVDTIPLGFHFRGSALHWAAIRGRRATCAALLEHGADPGRPDESKHQTASQWAQAGNNDELATFLRQS